MKKYHVDQVFGITRDIPLNYVHRNNLDKKFIELLATKRHIILFGCSKQGKTSLRKKYLNETNSISVYCQNNFSVKHIYFSILKQSGFEVRESEKNMSQKTGNINLGLKALWRFAPNIEAGIDKGKEVTKKMLEFDIEDVNDVIHALKSAKFSRTIILEDFHYLQDKVQEQFSYNLKIFEESSSFTFLIIGVWLDEYKLLRYNGDLSGRISQLNADIWTNDELLSVIKRGEDLLNLQFPKNFINHLIENSYGCISIVQIICNNFCKANNIEFTSEKLIRIDESVSFLKLYEHFIDLQNSKFIALLQSLYSQEEKEFYKFPIWVILSVISADIKDLLSGLSLKSIRNFIKKIVPQLHLRPLELEQFLQQIKTIQLNSNVHPVILEYDIGKRKLQIVDKHFFLWLANKSLIDILDDLGMEGEIELQTKMIMNI